MRRAVYPGSFDPVTYGHLDIIRRAASIFDEVVIGVLRNSQKTPLFSVEERVKILKNELHMAQTNKVLMPEIDTMFLVTSLNYAYLSSTTVRELASFKSDVSAFAPPAVVKALNEKFSL